IHAVRTFVGRAVHADQALSEIRPAGLLRAVPDAGSARVAARHLHPAADRQRAGQRQPDASALQHAPPDPDAAQLDAASRTGSLPANGASELDDRRPVAALAALARADRLDEWMVCGRRPDRVTDGTRAHAVDDHHRIEAGQPGVVEIAIERLHRLVDARATQ